MTISPSDMSSTLAAGVTVGDLGETALIDRIRRRVPPAPGWVTTGIGDDAAVIEPARGTLDVVTTDTLVEGIHFERSFVSAADLGHKTLAVNLSDLAAMGATPRFVVLSLVLPATMAAADLDRMVDGMLTLAGRHQVALVGGNITRSSGPLVLGMTAIGALRRRRVLTRAGGRPGDELWVTGTLGGAAAGLACLLRDPAGPAEGDSDLAGCVEHYRRPEPRVRIGTLLGRTRAAHAAIDLSDGLADGLRQLTQACDVGAVVDGGGGADRRGRSPVVRNPRPRSARRCRRRWRRLRAARRRAPRAPPALRGRHPSRARGPDYPHRRADKGHGAGPTHEGRRSGAPHGTRTLQNPTGGRRQETGDRRSLRASPASGCCRPSLATDDFRASDGPPNPRRRRTDFCLLTSDF